MRWSRAGQRWGASMASRDPGWTSCRIQKRISRWRPIGAYMSQRPTLCHLKHCVIFDHGKSWQVASTKPTSLVGHLRYNNAASLPRRTSCWNALRVFHCKTTIRCWWLIVSQTGFLALQVQTNYMLHLLPSLSWCPNNTSQIRTGLQSGHLPALNCSWTRSRPRTTMAQTCTTWAFSWMMTWLWVQKRLAMWQGNWCHLGGTKVWRQAANGVPTAPLIHHSQRWKCLQSLMVFVGHWHSKSNLIFLICGLMYCVVLHPVA